MLNYKEIGSRIRSFRISKELTQETLAEKIGVSLNYYGLIERGERGMCVETLYKLSEALGFSIDYVLLGTIRTETVTPLIKRINSLNEADKRHVADLLTVYLEAVGEYKQKNTDALDAGIQ